MVIKFKKVLNKRGASPAVVKPAAAAKTLKGDGAPIATTTTTTVRIVLKVIFVLSVLIYFACRNLLLLFETMGDDAPNSNNHINTTTNNNNNGVNSISQAMFGKVFMTTPKTTTAKTTTTTKALANIRCIWQPGNDTACVNHLVNSIRKKNNNMNGMESTALASTTGTSSSNNDSNNDDNNNNGHHRWILTGDSTMWRLFGYSPIKTRLMRSKNPCKDKYTCDYVYGHRCDTDKVFGFPRPAQWDPPVSKLEGPQDFGAQNPYCQDCQGCDSQVQFCQFSEESPSTCNLTTNSAAQSYYSFGGYVSIEFARDVEVQSKLHRTTQENFAQWLNDKWNTYAMVREFGRPVCLIATGIHDAAIKNMTTETYLDNVHSYISLLADQCSHIVWLANTSPASEAYPQKIRQTYAWNLAIMDILRTHYPHKSSFVDVFAASIRAVHLDNVHMETPWYRSLGTMFSKVIAEVGKATAKTT